MSTEFGPERTTVILTVRQLVSVKPTTHKPPGSGRPYDYNTCGVIQYCHHNYSIYSYIKVMYHVIRIKQQVSDSSVVHRSLQNYGSSICPSSDAYHLVVASTFLENLWTFALKHCRYEPKLGAIIMSDLSQWMPPHPNIWNWEQTQFRTIVLRLAIQSIS